MTSLKISNKKTLKSSFNNSSICNLLFLEIYIFDIVLVAEDAFSWDKEVLSLYFEVRLVSTQEFDAPESIMKLPSTPLILQLIIRWFVSVIIKSLTTSVFNYKKIYSDLILLKTSNNKSFIKINPVEIIRPKKA